MLCELCGEICRCLPDANAVASPRWLPDAEASLTAASSGIEFETPVEAPNMHPPPQASGPGDQPAAEDSHAWRQEVATRLNRYQARRKPRAPRYPSLRLRFEDPDPTPVPVDSSEEYPVLAERATSSHQALALDSFAGRDVHGDELPAAVAPPLTYVSASQETAAFRRAEGLAQSTFLTTAPAPTTAKIIEFPRSWTPAPAPVDELAEPVLNRDRPRILEAPEFVPPPPALGGITIEPAQQPEMERRPGIDIPLQSAPLSRRIFAAAIDGVIIAVARVLF